LIIETNTNDVSAKTWHISLGHDLAVAFQSSLFVPGAVEYPQDTQLTSAVEVFSTLLQAPKTNQA
jgi:hypothetical protein